MKLRDSVAVITGGAYGLGAGAARQRHAAAIMSRNDPDDGGERGIVINVSSVAAYDGVAAQVAYAASKGGVVLMTLPAARDLARWGICVITVCPGLFDTGMLAGLPDALQQRFRRLPVFPQRPGRPSEFGLFIESRTVHRVAEHTP